MQSSKSCIAIPACVFKWKQNGKFVAALFVAVNFRNVLQRIKQGVEGLKAFAFV